MKPYKIGASGGPHSQHDIIVISAMIVIVLVSVCSASGIISFSPGGGLLITGRRIQRGSLGKQIRCLFFQATAELFCFYRGGVY